MAWASIVIRNNPVITFEDFHLSLARDRFEQPKTTKRDMGGYWQAAFNLIPESREESLSFLNNGLGREITFHNDRGELDWEGMINTVELDTGIAKIQNSLKDMANKVWVRYTPIGGGDVARSTVYQDTESQNRYGIKEFVLSGGEIDAGQADQLAQSYLKTQFWPRPTLRSINTGGTVLATPKLSIKCIGYIQTLKWRRYNQTAVAGTQGSSGQVSDIITAIGQFVATTSIDANSTPVTKEYDADREALGIIEGCADLGDVNNNIWIADMGPLREFSYKEAAPVERFTS